MGYSTIGEAAVVGPAAKAAASGVRKGNACGMAPMASTMPACVSARAS